MQGFVTRWKKNNYDNRNKVKPTVYCSDYDNLAKTVQAGF